MKRSKKTIRKHQENSNDFNFTIEFIKESANDFNFTIEFITRLCNSKKFTKDDIISSVKALSKSENFSGLTKKENQVLNFVYAMKESALSALSCLEFETEEKLFDKFNDFVDERKGYLEFARKFAKYAKIIQIKNLHKKIQYLTLPF